MKKLLLSLPLLALFAAGFFGCSQSREWNKEQRQAMREALRDYRQMVYLDDLTDAEFVLFADGVANDLEGAYPVYTTFIEMPGVDDTVEMVVVTAIVDELNADAHNMRHIYPYNYLVSQFFNAVLADTTDLSQIRRMESQCANDLFEWSVTEIDVVETVPAQ